MLRSLGLFVVAATLLPSSLVAQATPGSTVVKTPDDPSTIVVTGQRIGMLLAALERCKARRCPAPEEISATLALAEAQFVAGDYPEARRTLVASRHRNARFAARYPEEVARLMNADSTMQALNGRFQQARVSSIDGLAALRRGLPDNDPRVLGQQLGIGRALAREGRPQAAEDVYDKVERLAREQKLTAIEANAMFRRAMLFVARAAGEGIYEERAERELHAIEIRTEPEFVPFQEGVTAARIKLAAMTRKHPEARVVQLSAGKVARTPVLIYEPVRGREDILLAAEAASKTGEVTVGSGAPEWADFRYRITPDGSVADLEVVDRSVAPPPGPWVDVAAKAIAAQRYLPLDKQAALDGIEQWLRYSVVHQLVSTPYTGSRVVSRSGKADLEITDMSPAPYLAKSAPAG